jgi:hypothetical protein
VALGQIGVMRVAAEDYFANPDSSDLQMSKRFVSNDAIGG